MMNKPSFPSSSHISPAVFAPGRGPRDTRRKERLVTSYFGKFSNLRMIRKEIWLPKKKKKMTAKKHGPRHGGTDLYWQLPKTAGSRQPANPTRQHNPLSQRTSRLSSCPIVLSAARLLRNLNSRHPNSSVHRCPGGLAWKHAARKEKASLCQLREHVPGSASGVHEGRSAEKRAGGPVSATGQKDGNPERIPARLLVFFAQNEAKILLLDFRIVLLFWRTKRRAPADLLTCS